jgi:hypothetical protein
MRSFLKAIGIAAFLVLVVFSLIKFSRENQQSKATVGYHASDEILWPYEIIKNPYKFMGHSGILDIRMPFVGYRGEVVANPWNLVGGLKFEKMIDEHVAIYSVNAYDQEGERTVTMQEGELAVILTDNEPPDISHPWRVFVEGQMEGVNGFGSKIKVTTVRFEGYCHLPLKKPAEVPR